jgi:hypothetical protein
MPQAINKSFVGVYLHYSLKVNFNTLSIVEECMSKCFMNEVSDKLLILLIRCSVCII